MRTLTPENVDEFFDGLIANLHSQGIFATYAEPKGVAVDEPYPYHKLTHKENPAKNARGLSFHVGDQPYHAGLSRGAAQLKPDQKEITLKTRVVQDAFKHYVPSEKFATYLRHFSENLNHPDHIHAMNMALQVMKFQLLKRRRNNKPLFTPEEVETFINSQTTGTRNARLRDAIDEKRTPQNTGNDHYSYLRGIDFMANAAELQQLDDHPELLLALVIFQAAHIAYRDELMDAIDRAYTPESDGSLLSADEHENAMSVSQFSLLQMEEIAIFPSLAPIIIHEWNKLKEQSPEADGQDQMAQAITHGWEAFFKGQLLKTDIFSTEPLNSEDYDTNRVMVVCPAKPHLRNAQQTGLLESVYGAIIQHHETLLPWIEETQKQATDALDTEPSSGKGTLRPSPITPRRFPYQVNPTTFGLDEFGYPFLEKEEDPNYASRDEARALIAPLNEMIASFSTSAVDPAQRASSYSNMLNCTHRLTWFSQLPIIGQSAGRIHFHENGNKHNVSDFHWAKIAEVINEALEIAPEHTEAIRAALPDHAKHRIHGKEPKKFTDKLKAQEVATKGGCPYHRG